MKAISVLLMLFTINPFLFSEWNGEFALGCNKSSGNTRSSQLNADIFLSKKRLYVYEFNLKGETFYSSSEGHMDGQKHSGMARYAFSFGKGEVKRWYNFYNVEAAHDKFADIDYRLLPGTGIGYWFADTDKMKLMSETAVGWEHTEYYPPLEDKGEAVLICRGFFEKQLYKSSKFSENIIYYPEAENFSNYRLHSETTVSSGLTEKLFLRVSLIDDYNSNPPAGIKENDLLFKTSVSYSF